MARVVESDVYSSGTYKIIIRHYANGGETAPDNVTKTGSSSSKSVTIKGNISSTLPTRNGYRFLGYAKSSGGAVTYQPGDQVSYTFNRSATFSRQTSYQEGDTIYVTNYYTTAAQTQYINVYAKWERAGYTVSYNAGGGSGAPEDQVKNEGTDLTLPLVTPTWTGHSFVKWNTSPSGTGTDYLPGGTYSEDADVTLYAIWATNEYTVAYDANGGTDAPEDQTKLYGETLTLSEDLPVRSGYTFVEWNTESDGSGTGYQPGGSYIQNAVLTLYAVWERSVYIISYDANGHGTPPQPQTKESGDSVIIAAAITVIGSQMVEWNTEPDGSGTGYDPGDTYTADEDITLYAIWTIAQFTVTFDADGGTVSPAAKTVYWGSKYGELPVPEKAGGTFYGWFDGDLLVTANSFVYLLDDVTLTAAWTPRSRMRAKGSDGELHTGALYVKGSDGEMHMAIAYVKGSDGQMHVNG